MTQRFKTLLMACMVMVIALPAFAQQRVTIKDLNTYENLTSLDSLNTHPLLGDTVSFTAIIVSNPRSSGTASADTDDSGNVTSISRIHVFVKDTTALSQGWQGMGGQIVESTYEWLSGLNRGDIVDFTARLSNFGRIMQIDLLEEPTLVGSTDVEFPEYAPLLEPIEIDLSEIIEFDGSEYSMNLDNYTNYVHQYVRIPEGTILRINEEVDRPNWGVIANGVRINHDDLSLRYRNDRDQYLSGFNFRRPEDENFIPRQGAQAIVSGFLNIDTFNPLRDSGEEDPFQIAAWEDGIVWNDDGTQRLVNGESYPEFGEGFNPFVWPNDLVYTGFPALLTTREITPASPTSDDDVLVSIEVQAQGDNVVVDSVALFYTTSDTSVRLPMINAGNDIYEATIPSQPANSAVSYYIEAYTSNGLTGRAPTAGTLNYFILEEAITSISLIQRTADEMEGTSPLADVGPLPMDITATVLSDAIDGPIVVHDDSTAWSGIFLELNDQTEELSRGDIINITRAEVKEDRGDQDNDLLTYLSIPENGLSVISSGNETTSLIPSFTTDTFNAVEAVGEKYEGMIVRFVDVQVTRENGFGEFLIQTNGDSTTVIVNDDTDASIAGEFGIPNGLNETMRIGVPISELFAGVYIHRGDTKVEPRDKSDIVADNYSRPQPVRSLLEPVNGTALTVEGDPETEIVVQWGSTFDFDGDDVLYEWVLTTADDSDFEDTLTELPSDNNGIEERLTLTSADIRDLLASLNVEAEETVDLLWSIRASNTLGEADGLLATDNDFAFTSNILSYEISLTRGTLTNLEEELPLEFALEQNYPNPFNPTTNIDFALPQSGQVQLSVYNMLGQRVATLVDQRMEAGRHSINFNAANLSTGMYIYRLTSGDFTMTRKMTLIK